MGNLHPLEVVSRAIETQLKVGDNLKFLTSGVRICFDWRNSSAEFKGLNLCPVMTTLPLVTGLDVCIHTPLLSSHDRRCSVP